jgi:flavin reductase (DIM6/NTAB) family NADH-FMN oxidoreductase RutF
LVDGCIAWFECELRDLVGAGDHDVALGAVVAAGREAGEPLVLWDRAFWRLG